MLKVESYKKGIILSTAFNIVNKGMVFANGLLVAYFFGAQTNTDIFFYLNNSILILGAYFTSINTAVVIPESMRLREQKGEKESTAFLNFFLYLYTALIVLTILLVSINPILFFQTVSNFKTEELSHNATLLALSLPLFAMICIINLLVDILASHKFFTIPMMIGIINGSASIIFVLLFHNYFGIKSILYGLLLSYALNMILLIYLMKRYLHWQFDIIKLVTENRIWKNFGFANFGNFTSTLAGYIPMYILSGFSTGVITALTFAQQISSLPTMLITFQFSSVAGIKFNELFARKNFDGINAAFTQTANFLHFLMVPVSFMMFQFSDEISHVILMFTSLGEEAVNYINIFLRYLSLVIPLLVINSLISRLFMASHKIKESFWYQVLFNIILITLLYVGVTKYGIIGYPLAMVATYLLNLVSCYFLEKKYFSFIDYLPIIKKLAILILINIIIGLIVFMLIEALKIEDPLSSIAVGGSVYSLLLFFTTHFLKLNDSIIVEVEGILKKIKS